MQCSLHHFDWDREVWQVKCLESLCGQDPKLWPVSPVKLGQPAQAGASILDVEFTDEEDEEDDEYEPSRDVEVT